MQVHHRADEVARRAHRASNDVGRATQELRRAVHDDIGAVSNRREDQRRERVVDDEARAVFVCDPRERRKVRDLQRRIGKRLDVEHARLGLLQRIPHRIEIVGVDERRLDTGARGQVVLQQRERPAVERRASDDALVLRADLQQRRGNRSDAGARCITSLRALHRREHAPECEHRRVEVPPVEVATARRTACVRERPAFAAEDARHHVRGEHGERRARFDREVHAAVFAEFVAGARHRGDGVELVLGLRIHAGIVPPANVPRQPHWCGAPAGSTTHRSAGRRVEKWTSTRADRTMLQCPSGSCSRSFAPSRLLSR